MIAPLRRRHRLWTLLLAVVVPALYVVALAARTSPPIDEVPQTLKTEPATGEVLWEAGDLFAEHEIVVRARRSASGFGVELEPLAAIPRPEILVYWSPQAPGDSLAAEVFLLGSLAGTRPRGFDLPPAALGRDGWLVLYSLGHQEIVDSAVLGGVGDGALEGAQGGPVAAPLGEFGGEGSEAPAPESDSAEESS